MKKYNLYRKPSKGIILISSQKFGVQVWVLSAQSIQKEQMCSICERWIKRGSERMYRPITNGYNRMDRICLKCVERNEMAKKYQIRKFIWCKLFGRVCYYFDSVVDYGLPLMKPNCKVDCKYYREWKETGG